MSDGARTSQIDDPVGGHTTGPTGAAIVVVVVGVEVVVAVEVVVEVVLVEVVLVEVVLVEVVLVEVVLVVGGLPVVATSSSGIVVTGGPEVAVATDDVAATPSMSDEQPAATSRATAAAPIGDRTARFTLEV